MSTRISALMLGAAALITTLAHPVRAQQIEEEGYRSHPYLTPAGDLDGDGSEDLIGHGQVLDDTDYRISAYRGSDGTVLWTHEEAGGIRAIPSPVGPQGEAGLILAVSSGGGIVTFAGNTGGQANYAAQALSLVGMTAGGDVIWRREFVGQSPAVMTSLFLDTGTDMPFFGGTLQATSSAADDALVIIHDYVPTPDGQANEVTVIVVDGADGTTAASYHVQIGTAEGTARPAPDLSGDGLDDFLVFTGSSSGPDSISAVRGDSGQSLWATQDHPLTVHQGFYAGSAPSIDRRVVHLGDTSGDGISDIGISQSSSPADPYIRTFSVIDGATGGTTFTEMGDLVRGVGDVDGDGLADVGTQNLARSSSDAGAAYETYDGDGTITRFVEHTVSVPEGATTGVTLLPSVGDVDGDGFDDAAHRVSIALDGETTQRDLVVSGRGYEAIGEGLLATALRASVDGQGDDMALVDPFGQSVIDIVARDGATGEELWTTRLRPRGETTNSTLLSAVDVTGDGRAEILVSVENSTPGDLPSNLVQDERHIDAFVLSAIDGSVLWSSP